MNAAACAMFFCSGAAALLFETLWFRQAGLMLGNTVWASALVMAAFMGGLALGNAFVIRVGWRLQRPLRAFALLELVVATSGAGLVLAFPRLCELAAPQLSSLRGSLTLDALRLFGTFALLVAPASAMGATLPVLARSLGARDANFGRVLGRLYGCNTLGAVAGALAGEGVLIPAFGVPGTALGAAGLDLLAAAVALRLERSQPALGVASLPDATLTTRAARLAAGAFLAGALLLALEVVWLRFMLLFVIATTETFAIMLAVVLLGIGGGGLLASAWLGRRPGDAHLATPLALGAGAATVAGYGLLHLVLPAPAEGVVEGWSILGMALWLMLPVSTASGAIFTFLGHALRAEAGEDARAAGLLTLVNTLGAMLGSLVAGFVLLPLVGMERSFFVLAAAYGAVAALALATGAGPGRGARRAATLLFGAALVLFPVGAMRHRYVGHLESYWRRGSMRVVAVREGLSETAFLLRRDVLGRPFSFRLLTNATSMSSTDYPARRYMGLFVWLPVALHRGPRSALLICYGLGNTARTLTATTALARIDVVDVSPDVLAMSRLVWPDPGDDPLRDPRVRVHVEDGRFFLAAGAERYDLITGEPPPPKNAGIVNLYSREYFSLMRARLADGGFASYWLPVLQLEPRETLAIIRGFCEVFDDCSLWTAFGHEWMLLGTRAARGPVPGASFARQWRDPVVAPRLSAAGLETPAQLGATFLADAATLALHTAEVAPLVDSHPQRVSPRQRKGHNPSVWYARLMETTGARERFRASPLIRRMWPEEWIEASLPAFDAQALLNRLAWSGESVLPALSLADQEAAITRGGETLALWSLGTSAEEQALARRAADAFTPERLEILGLQALARRRYAEAGALLGAAEAHAAHAARLRRWRILAAGLAGDRPTALRLLAEAGPVVRAASREDRDAWAWLAERFELPAAGS
jgi:predicted membrane-bound spermidine synthase